MRRAAFAFLFSFFTDVGQCWPDPSQLQELMLRNPEFQEHMMKLMQEQMGMASISQEPRGQNPAHLKLSASTSKPNISIETSGTSSLL